MMIVAVIMRRRRRVLKDMNGIMVMRGRAAPEALMVKIHAVDADDTDDAHGRTSVSFFIGLVPKKPS